jgi:hypothetical protein
MCGSVGGAMAPGKEGRGDPRCGSDGGAIDLRVEDREEGLERGDVMSGTEGGWGKGSLIMQDCVRERK